MHGFAVSLAALALLGTTTMLADGAAAQPAQTRTATARTVIAGAKLPTVVAEPLRFELMSVTLQAGQSSSFKGARGIIYQLSGSTAISARGKTQTLDPGAGALVAAGTKATLRAAGGKPSTFLHFLLTPATQQAPTAAAAPAGVRPLYRTASPIPDLKAGAYDLNLTRITFPPKMPSNPPHYRSGAALYDILSGTGANTIAGKTHARPPGAVIYEPFGLVHQWGNPGATPLTFLVFNINPDGTAAVLPGTPPGRK
ncbi:MAG: cupin domain-containing protein [Acetobacteraceae bacterium]